MHCSCYAESSLSHSFSDLLQFIREVYWDYEYEEVVTPNIYNFDLWKTSGHAEHYKQNMFSFDIEKQEFGLKPMNCPGPSPVQCCLYNLPCFFSLTRSMTPFCHIWACLVSVMAFTVQLCHGVCFHLLSTHYNVLWQHFSWAQPSV